MIEFKTGNLFDSSCNTIVNTVNCEGVMGKGIALECKNRYPFMFKCYQNACKYGSKGNNYYPILKEGGDIYFWYNPKFNSDSSYKLFEDELEKIYPGIYDGKDNKCILNFATKVFWRNPSKVEWIERGLYNFCERLYDGEHYYNLGPDTWTRAMSSIAWPKLGCNNGQLDWESQVKPLMIKYLSQLPENIKIEIYE